MSDYQNLKIKRKKITRPHILNNHIPEANNKNASTSSTRRGSQGNTPKTLSCKPPNNLHVCKRMRKIERQGEGPKETHLRLSPNNLHVCCYMQAY